MLAELILTSEMQNKYVDSTKQLKVVTTNCNEEIKDLKGNNQQIVLKPAINSIRFVNKFFGEINASLDNEGVFIGAAETAEMRKKRIFNNNRSVVNYLIYFFDFVFHRLMPKFSKPTRYLYFSITKGKCRVMPKAEILGRLCACGFQILDYTEEQNKLTFLAKKIGLPDFNSSPSYGPFFKMKRLGKNGLMINVHKVRTMHAYSEYLQAYINDTNGLDEGGKFKNDFRVSSYGRFFRKFWIDELPMIVNLVYGDIKLVGVRPISKHYFNLFSDELKQLRQNHKPGLIPPFYVDLPKTFEEIMESEKKYLLAYNKNPLQTDVSYLKKSVTNILFKRARSK